MEQYISKKEIAGYLKYSIHTIRALEKKGLPFYKVHKDARKHLYKKEEVETWVKSQKCN